LAPFRVFLSRGPTTFAYSRLRNKVLAGEYRLALPAEKQLVEELARTQKALETFYRRREA